MPRASRTAPERSLLERVLLDRWEMAAASAGTAADGAWLDDSLADLPPSGSAERVMVLHALVARVQSLEIASLAEVARCLGGGEPAPCERGDGSWAVPARATVEPAVVDEVAPALCLGRESARRRIAEAEQLVRCLPRTHRLLTDGMGELRLVGPAPDVRALHDALTRRAKDRSRCGDVDPYADLVSATGPAAPGPAAAPGAAGALGIASRPVRDGRTLDARRLDAAVTALAAVATAPDGASAPLVELSVGVSTPMGLDESAGELSGHGPVPAVLARAWSRRGRLRRFFTDPATGTVVAVDGHTYPPGTVPLLDAAGGDADGAGGHTGGGDPGGGSNPGGDGDGHAGGGGDVEGDGGGGGPRAGPGPTCPAAGTSGDRIPVAVRRVVTAAMPRCAAPGCSVPAARCDLDHRVPWPSGPTCACNLAPLCRTHHRMKTLRGWTVRAGPPADDAEPAAVPSGRGDGTLTWTSPLGAIFETCPEHRWPVLATDPVAAARSAERRRARNGAHDDTAGDHSERSEPAPTSGRASRARVASRAPTWLTDPGAPPPF